MIKKVIIKQKLSDQSAAADLEYWLKQTPEDRVSAVEQLRRQHYGNTARLQRTARVIQLSQK